MYLLYVDESDTTDIKNGILPRWYCISGVRVLDRSCRKIQERFQKLLLNNDLPNDFEKFEIKGEELYNGTGFWKNKEPQKRVDFSMEICKFINESNLLVYSALEVVKNNNHVESYKKLLNEILNTVASYVAQSPITSRQFVLIFDQRPDIESEIHCQIKSSRKEILERFKRSCSFIDYGFDGDSKLCWGIQVADFVSYFLRKQQILQRQNNLFLSADNHLSIQVVDKIIKSIKKKCKVKIIKG